MMVRGYGCSKMLENGWDESYSTLTPASADALNCQLDFIVRYGYTLLLQL